jgi:hypothetical protein
MIQQLKTPYMDTMSMPVYERRFFINMLLKQHEKQKEMYDNQTANNSNAKGSRQSKISGDALKSKMKSGEIPLN